MTALPRLLVLTDRTQTGGRPLLEVLRAAADGGARAVLVREKDLSGVERDALVEALRPYVEVLLVAAGPTGRPALDRVDGVHLAARDPLPTCRPRLLGRSCHDADELRRAGLEGCDYVTVSPVFPSPSKPGYGPPVTLAGLRALAGGSTVPVFALGGVTAERAAACVDAGAHGVAVMGAVMRAPDPAGVVAALVEAVDDTGGPR